MNDILIELYCEATMKSYDFWLPKAGLIKDIAEKLAEEIMIYENNDNLFETEAMDNLCLVAGNTGRVLNNGFTLQESGIMGGNKLILV